ncbi:MAG: phosphatidate cytidylyltransferase [Chlorobi bacterium]|nr:phosphatidate cytidylyltransferase [Chlorobiota bacterium]
MTDNPCRQPGNTEHSSDHLGLRAEVARKAIHLSSISIAVIYCHISRDIALLLLVPLFSGFFLVDLLKNVSAPVAVWYHRSFGAMLREHELETDHLHLNGATCITLSALLLVLIFPKVIAIAAFSMVAVSDTVAALAGKVFGRHRFGHKSLEGSGAFLLSAIAIVVLVPNLNLQAGLLMAVTATLTEAFVIRIGGFKLDDNLTIPLVSAASGMICYLFFFPEHVAALSFCR